MRGEMPIAYQVPVYPEVINRPLSKVAVIFPAYLALAGTGGLYHAEFVAKLASFSPTSLVHVVGQSTTHRRTRSVVESLLTIRDVLGLKMSELARIFGVSRTAVYDWIRGSVPKSEIAVRIDLLGRCSDDLREVGLTDLSSSVRIFNYSGVSFVDALAAEQDPHPLFSALRRAALSEDQNPIQRRGSSSEARSNTDFNSEFLTPVILERA
jgi:transcriptional regulator with XRE-family HTH domain